jgi:hypothetical protein
LQEHTNVVGAAQCTWQPATFGAGGRSAALPTAQHCVAPLPFFKIIQHACRMHARAVLTAMLADRKLAPLFSATFFRSKRLRFALQAAQLYAPPLARAALLASSTTFNARLLLIII